MDFTPCDDLHPQCTHDGKRFGLARACALGRDGSSWPPGHPPGRARPEVMQHDAEPEQDQDHQLIVDEMWDHNAP
jgi:hypothetical protein